jgi:hypothetical protein
VSASGLSHYGPRETVPAISASRGIRSLLLLVGRATAGGFGARGVDCGAAFLYIDNLAFLVHDESGSIGNPGLGYENAVGSGHFTIEEIAQQWE